MNINYMLYLEHLRDTQSFFSKSTAAFWQGQAVQAILVVLFTNFNTDKDFDFTSSKAAAMRCR